MKNNLLVLILALLLPAGVAASPSEEEKQINLIDRVVELLR